MLLDEFAAYLDSYLRVREAPDFPNAHNGLQVAGERRVSVAAFAVDACRFTIEAATQAGADVLVVHHGLFWGQTVPVTGALYHRLAGLIRSGMGLYSCHLPLDAHEEVGNNHVLCRMLGLEPTGTWCSYEGHDVGVLAETDMPLVQMREQLDARLDTTTRLIAGGADRVRRVAILTGAGADSAGEAASLGCDTLITGEGPHHSYFLAEEAGINVLLAGHYATEVVGVRALMDHVASRLGLACAFLDHPTGL